MIVEGGNGRIVADVAWAIPGTGSANDVVLTTFDPATADLEGDALQRDPADWATAGLRTWAPEAPGGAPG